MDHSSFPNIAWPSHLVLQSENVAQPAQAFYSESLASSSLNDISNDGSYVFEMEVEQISKKHSRRRPQEIERKSRKKLVGAHVKLAKALSRVRVSAQGRANAIEKAARVIDALVKRMDPLNIQEALSDLQASKE